MSENFENFTLLVKILTFNSKIKQSHSVQFDFDYFLKRIQLEGGNNTR